jgi:hypothetical protein
MHTPTPTCMHRTYVYTLDTHVYALDTHVYALDTHTYPLDTHVYPLDDPRSRHPRAGQMFHTHPRHTCCDTWGSAGTGQTVGRLVQCARGGGANTGPGV